MPLQNGRLPPKTGGLTGLIKDHYSATYELPIHREIEKHQGITFSTYALL